MKSQLKGDTLVEVMFAVGIFGAVAIGAIGIMNRGLYDAQKALEITMARQEIDAQAEALRFIHEAYISEQNLRTSDQVYTKVWKNLESLASSPGNDFFTNYNGQNCGTTSSKTFKSFIINIRRLNPNGIAALGGSSPKGTAGNKILITGSLLNQTPTYPRLLYGFSEDTDPLSDAYTNSTGALITKANTSTTLTAAQGIWVTSVGSTNSEFFDFYIRTCWFSPGSATANTVSTVVRLFNPNPDYRP